MTELLLFGSTFVTVFALGFQSLNVNQGQYIAAFVTSFAIGGASLVLYKLLPEASVTQCAAYLLGGATGIVSSMWAHRRWKAWWAKFSAEFAAYRDGASADWSLPKIVQRKAPDWPPAKEMPYDDKVALAKRLFPHDWLHHIRQLPD